MRVLITGGAGFIGSAVSRHLIENCDDQIHVLDKLTYAGNLDSLEPIAGSSRYSFARADICDRHAVLQTLLSFRPDVVMHLAAESHVDRSIDGPSAFIETNVVGTFTMLDAALEYWRGLDAADASAFRFIHISTDEVFGTLGGEGFWRKMIAERAAKGGKTPLHAASKSARSSGAVVMTSAPSGSRGHCSSGRSQ